MLLMNTFPVLQVIVISGITCHSENFGNRMSLDELGEVDVIEFLTASKGIHFIMQDIVSDALNNSFVEKQCIRYFVRTVFLHECSIFLVLLNRYVIDDVIEFLTASKGIHFIMQDIVSDALLNIVETEPIERETSAFDEYDRENGYEDFSSSMIFSFMHCPYDSRMSRIAIFVTRSTISPHIFHVFCSSCSSSSYPFSRSYSSNADVSLSGSA